MRDNLATFQTHSDAGSDAVVVGVYRRQPLSPPATGRGTDDAPVSRTSGLGECRRRTESRISVGSGRKNFVPDDDRTSDESSSSARQGRADGTPET